MNIITKFDIQDHVYINNDPHLVAQVQRIIVSSNGAMYEVGYFDSSGGWKEPTFYEWQLSRTRN